MTLFARIDADAEAFGHPTACTEPAPGFVQSSETPSVTITNASGETKGLAATTNADLHFPSHGHDVSDGDCIDFHEHTFDPAVTSDSVTINGGGVYLVQDGVDTDPIVGGDVDIINSGTNNSVSET